MSETVSIEVEGRSVSAFRGDRLLDAIVLAGLDLGQDCRSGRCTMCPVRVVEGQVSGGETQVAGEVLACRATVGSNLKISLPRRAGPPRAEGVVAGIVDLTRDVTEVTVALAGPFTWQPGQYVHVTFAGFPARAFSPTVALDGMDRPASFRLHIARIAGGAVSSAIGRQIPMGHRVAIDGPFGSAVLQPGSSSRLVLYSGGTGFAPMWAIADAALRENATRRMLIVAGTPALENLYMAEALERMSRCPNVVILPVTAEPQNLTPVIRTGSPVDFASAITAGDTVHAAGPPEMVQALALRATAVGATFRADPFTPSATDDDRWLAQAARRFASQPPPKRRPPQTVPNNASLGASAARR